MPCDLYFSDDRPYWFDKASTRWRVWACGICKLNFRIKHSERSWERSKKNWMRLLYIEIRTFFALLGSFVKCFVKCHLSLNVCFLQKIVSIFFTLWRLFWILKYSVINTFKIGDMDFYYHILATKSLISSPFCLCFTLVGVSRRYEWI